MQETPQYPQLTPEQIDLWLTDPVTKVYLNCLLWFRDDVRDSAANGETLDSSNTSLTHAMSHINQGQQQALASAMDHSMLFDRYKMVLITQEKE